MKTSKFYETFYYNITVQNDVFVQYKNMVYSTVEYTEYTLLIKVISKYRTAIDRRSTLQSKNRKVVADVLQMFQIIIVNIVFKKNPHGWPSPTHEHHSLTRNARASRDDENFHSLVVEFDLLLFSCAALSSSLA